MENYWGGHSHTQVKGTKNNVSNGSWVDLTSGTTLQKGRWLILSFVEATGNSTRMANKIIVGSEQRATRVPGDGGGGVSNYYITDSDGTKTAKLQVYNYDSSAKNYNYSLDFIRLA